MGPLRIVVLIGALAAARCLANLDTGCALLVDGNNLFAQNLRAIEKNQINNFTFDKDLNKDPKWRTSDTDLPKLRTGKVGAQFWVAYAGCKEQYKDATEQALEQIDVIKRLIKKNKKYMQFVNSTAGIEEVFRSGKIACLIGVGGGGAIDSRLGVLRMYYKLGVRFLTLTHDCDTPWATAAVSKSGTRTKSGLTEYGKIVVKEMNRLGMMVDLSQTSHQTRLDALEVSTAPIILSHSSTWTVCNHEANVRDDILKEVAKKDGVVMVNFNQKELSCDNTEPTVDHVVAHINHIRKVAGVNHIGIGSGFDGLGGKPRGVEDASKFLLIFDRLANDPSWSDDMDLRKLAGLNVLRVFKKVEEERDKLANKLPAEDLLSEDEIPEEALECFTKYEPPPEEKDVGQKELGSGLSKTRKTTG